MPPTWTLLGSKVLQDCSVFTVKADRYRSPRTGQAHDFYLIESPDWVNIIPLTPDGKIILVKQFRFGTKDFSLEIPGGMLEPEDTPASAACRELLEETGYGGDEPILLGTVQPNPAIQTNRCATYLIENCTRRAEIRQDSTEDITEVQRVPLAEIPGLIRDGQITHALVIAAFYWFFSREFAAGREKDKKKDSSEAA
jgi:ADP-ribose pyrophosphatase